MVVGLNLGLAGMEVGEASSGADAFDMLSDGEWDACLVDLMMPGSDGFELIEALKTSGQIDEMVVVVLSAEGSPSSAIRAMKLGAVAHLTKPFSPNAVGQILAELIETPAEERQARRLESIQRAGALERMGVHTV
jgi:two-component system response regulator AtoC